MEDARRLWRILVAGLFLPCIAIIAVALADRESEARAGASGYGTDSPAGMGTWSNAAPMPIYRSEMGAALLNERIYVAGGLAGPSKFFTGTTYAFQSYDYLSNTWREETSLPVRLHHLGIATLNGRIYITGGFDGEDFNIDVRLAWVFDPTTGAWSRIADMPQPRAAHASVAIGNLLYVVGGVGPSSQELWTYDPATNIWDRSRAVLPTVREHLAAVALNDKLYVIGGRWCCWSNNAVLEEYDPVTNTWTTRPSMPTARGGLTASVVNGKIHVTGGEDLFSNKTYDQHEVYDPVTNSWATYPKMPTPRHGLPSATANGRWYVIGGGRYAGNQTYSSLLNIVEVFDPLGTPIPTASVTSVPTHTSTRTATIVPTSTSTVAPTVTGAPPTATAIPATSTPIPPTATAIPATSTPVLPTATSTTAPSAIPTATPCPIQFSDVLPDDPFYSFVRCLACRGIISGYGDGTFRPGNDVTRGQLSKIVANAAGFNEPVQGQRFVDVPPTDTFYEFIERLAGRGIIGGYGDGTFRPGNPATRGQISKVVANAANFNEPVQGQTFIDVPPTHTFYEFIERLAARGIVSGYGDGTFRPENNATRGQVAKIVANTFSPNCQTP